jgi:hypothetical protein
MAISFCSWDAACETSVDRLQKLETEEFHKGSLACPEYSGLTQIGRVRYLIESGVLGQPKKTMVMPRSIRSAGVGINIKDWEATGRDLMRTRYPLAATLALQQAGLRP